jgi:hypothetical protein
VGDHDPTRPLIAKSAMNGAQRFRLSAILMTGPPANPQSLNLFAYVGNNPLVRADADGHAYSIAASSGCFTEMEFHNMNGPNCRAIYSPTPSFGPVAGGSENDLAMTRYLESGTIPWLDPEGNLKTWVRGHEVPYGPYVPGHWESSGLGVSGLEVAQNAPNNPSQPQQQKHQCSDMERMAKAWHGVETVGTVAVGVGTMATGVAGWGAACFSGNPLLCFAASEAAPAFIVGGYYVTKSAVQELREPNNPTFGGDCQ